MSPPLPTIGSTESAHAAVGLLENADAVLVHEDGKPVGVLTRQDLLAFLAGRPRQAFSRAQLLHSVWDSAPEYQDPATVTVSNSATPYSPRAGALRNVYARLGITSRPELVALVLRER